VNPQRNLCHINPSSGQKNKANVSIPLEEKGKQLIYKQLRLIKNHKIIIYLSEKVNQCSESFTLEFQSFANRNTPFSTYRKCTSSSRTVGKHRLAMAIKVVLLVHC